jgi:hypothetical protein
MLKKDLKDATSGHAADPENSERTLRGPGSIARARNRADLAGRLQRLEYGRVAWRPFPWISNDGRRMEGEEGTLLLLVLQ